MSNIYLWKKIEYWISYWNILKCTIRITQRNLNHKTYAFYITLTKYVDTILRLMQVYHFIPLSNFEVSTFRKTKPWIRTFYYISIVIDMIVFLSCHEIIFIRCYKSYNYVSLEFCHTTKEVTYSSNNFFVLLQNSNNTYL